MNGLTSKYARPLKLFLVMLIAVFLTGAALLAGPMTSEAAKGPGFVQDDSIGGADPKPQSPPSLASPLSTTEDGLETLLPMAQQTSYTIPIVIDNTDNTSVLTDYQILVTWDTATPIAQGRMRSDCGDIRFYDSTQAISLSYWLESGCNTSETKVWVKVPSIPATSAQKIHLSYGNSNLTSTSNGEAVFEFFDDFNGASLDTNKWAIIGNTNSLTLVTGYLDVTMADRNGTGVVSNGIRAADSTFQAGYSIVSRAKDPDGTGNDHISYVGMTTLPACHTFWQCNQKGLVIYQNSVSNFISDSRDTTRSYNESNYDLPSNWHTYRIDYVHGSLAKFYRDDDLKYTQSTDNTIPDSDDLYPVLGGDDYSNVDPHIYYDWVFVRQTTLPEPSTFEAGLVLSQSGSTEAPLGGVVTYSLTIQNNDIVTASNVVITQTLPVSIAFASASTTPQKINPLVWQLGNLPALTSTTLTITGPVGSAATIGSSLLATATVTSDLTEVNLTNNTASFTSTVAAGPGTWLALTIASEVDMLMPFMATIRAYDQNGNIATGYTGTVTLTSTGVVSGFPVTHSFNTSDQGIYTFTNLALKTAGLQTIIAADGVLSQTRGVLVDDDVVVDKNTTWRETNISLKSLTVTGTAVLILERITEFITPTTITATDSITVGNEAKILADGQGYGSHSGPGNGQNYPISYGSGGGGGYGGYGGYGSQSEIGGAGGTAYGDYAHPNEMGSGGGYTSGFGGIFYGGTGGGAVKLVATNLSNDGLISANGTSGQYTPTGGRGSGGGSGGSLWIAVDRIEGNGQLTVNGGNGGGGVGGGGAGGRIAIYYTDGISATEMISAMGGSGSQYGGAGTIYLKSSSQTGGDLVIDNSGHSGQKAAIVDPDGTPSADTYNFDLLELRGNGDLEQSDSSDTIIIGTNTAGDNTAQLYIKGKVNLSSITDVKDFGYYLDTGGILQTSSTLNIGSVRVTNRGKIENIVSGEPIDVTIGLQNGTVVTGGRLELYANASGALGGEYTFGDVDIKANNTLELLGAYTTNLDGYGVTISASNITVSGTISADGQGYGSESGLGPGQYPGYGYLGAGGGGHGGYGGPSSAAGGSPYGDFRYPTNLGSGGGHGSSYFGYVSGGTGGGAIKLAATTLVNGGRISANGTEGACNGACGGGGSGGSIWIDAETMTLEGNGQIIANGGNGSIGGGGAGGRIAIYAATNNFSGTLQVNGGSGNQAGHVGTIYLGYVDPLTSTVEISPTSIPANGIAAGTITVTLRTITGALIAGEPVSVTLTSGSQTNTYINGQPASIGAISLGETNANGIATGTITSTTSETKTVEAVSGVVRLVNPGSVFFDTDFVDAAASTVSIQGPSTVAANGSDTIEVQVTARDKFGNLVPNVATTLGTTPAVTVAEVNSTTNSFGQATYHISYDQPTQAVISATVNSQLVGNVVTATFQGPDLVLSQSGPAQVTAGYPLTYNITIANAGLLTATNIVVTDTLPTAATFITTSYPHTYYPASHTVVWQVASLPQNGQINLALQAQAAATATGTIINQLASAVAEVDLSPTNNQISLSIPVVPPAPLLTVSPTYPTLPVLQGQTGILTITVRNAGTGIMTNTQVAAAATLPDWITVSSTNLGNIPPGQTAVFTITADTTEVETPGHYRDVFTVNADGLEPEYILLDAHVQGPKRDLQLTLTNNIGAVVAGANVTLREDIYVVTAGQLGTQPYYRQGVTDQAGRLTFADLETDKTYNFDLSAYNHDSKSGSITVTNGASTQPWAETLTGLPRLTVSPGTLDFGVARGSLSQQELILRNPGAVTLTNISVTNPDNIPWVYLSEPAADAVIPPGGELSVWVNAAPPLTETVSQHQDSIEITASNGNSATADLDITLNDGITRTLCLNVVTEVNSPLTDGIVRLVDQTGQFVVATNGVTETVQQTLSQATDSNGQTCFADLRPGQYLATVGRGEQKLGEKEIEVMSGVGAQQETISVDEPSIIVNWSVTKIGLEDIYTTVMTMTFVPEEKPTLTLSPRAISLCQPGGNGVVTETVTIHNFYPVTFTLAVLELEALGNVRATITTTTGSAFSVLPDGKTTLLLGDIPPDSHVSLTLHASFDEQPGQCMDGDAGAILLKVSANYKYYTPNYAWYGGASITPTLVPLSQTTTIPLKLVNSGYPDEANLNTPPPAMQNITLTNPDQLTWMTISPTNIISLPVEGQVPLTLTVNPPQWLAHGTYYDEVWVKATNGVTGLIGIKAEMSATGLRVETQLVTALFSDASGGGQASLPDGGVNWRTPGLAYPLTYIPPGQLSGEPQVSVWSNLVSSQNANIGEVTDIFGEAWVLQVLNCECASGQPKPRPTWSWLGNQLVAVKKGDPGPPGSGGAYAPEFKDNLVILRVTQRYALEREAFNAQLELINGTAASVSDIEVDITITDEGGAPVLMRQPDDPMTPTQTITPNFPANSAIPTSTLAANMPSSWIENGDANFIIIPGEPTALGSLGAAGQSNDRKLGSWTIIPDASGITGPLGKNYYVYATISYNGNRTITTTRELITVQPQPKILLDYFIPRYAFANQPFDWLVIATNVGYGAANNFSMGQPKIEILKQSDQHPTNFKVSGQSTLQFARIEPGKQVTGTWQITADHNGYFRDIEADCLHQNYQGIELPPLVYCKPTIHIIENTPPDDASQWGKDNSCTLGSWQAFDSDPVNTYSGNFTYNHLDVSIPTWGLPLAFERAYNSRDPEDGPLGWGWTHNYNIELIRETYIPAVTIPISSTQGSGSSGGSGGGGGGGSSGSSLPVLKRSAKIGKIATPPGLTLYGQSQDIMTVRLPHGSRAYFEVVDHGNANFTFTPFPGVKAELVQAGDVYTLTLPTEQTTYIFNANQKLAYLEDKNGNRLTFDYITATVPSEWRLERVTDPAGRSLTFAYDANKRMVSMTDPLSRTMNFGYTNGYLTSMTDFRGKTTTYAYTPASTDPASGQTLRGQLTTLTDANNHAEVTNHYDDKRRVDWQEDAGSNRTTFSYASDEATGAQTTTTTDPRGQVTIDHYNDKGQLIKQTDAYGFFEEYEYDAAYNLIRLVDKKGHQTLYDWNDCGCDYELVTDPMGFTTTMTYNGQHQLTSMTDERGYVTTMTYDSRSNPLTVDDPLTGTVEYTYGSRGQLLSKTDENNHITYYGYDLYGNTTVITDALGQVTRMSYDLAGRLLSTTDALNRVTTYSYDPGNNLLQAVDPLTGTTSLTYDNVGNRLTTTDALNRTSSFAYDARNNLTQVTNPLSGVHTFGYDANRNLVSETNEKGQVTAYHYDGLNRVLTLTNALSGTLGYTYDPVGNKLTERDANGNITGYVYDANDRIKETVYPDGSKMVAYYDSADNLLSLTDGENRTLSYQYDALGRVTIMYDPITGTVVYSYDAVGNQTAVTDAAGRTSRYSYDALNRLIAATDPLSGETESTYDAVGNVLSVTDAEGRTTSFAYDALNRVIRATDPLSGVVEYSYDALGNKLQMVDQLDRATSYQYDALNRLTEVEGPALNVERYTYDVLGNLLSATDAENRTTTYQYDSLNRLVNVTDPLSGTLAYTYDANGNRLTETDAEGRITRYAYDVFNQVITVTNAAGDATAMIYDKVGNLKRLTDAEGRVTQYLYDGLDRLKQVTDPKGYLIQYTYDPAGNKLSETDQEGRTTHYVYDALNRLATIRDMANNELNYNYDRVGNLTTLVDPLGQPTQYTYDDLDRLVSVTDALSQTTTYTYDAMGNQLSLTDAKGRTITYQYDALNRLIGTTDPLSQTTVLTYSLTGNLLQTANPKLQVTNYEYDALDRLTEVIDALNQSTRYSYDRVGNQLSVTDPNNHTTTMSYDSLNRLSQTTNPLNGITTYGYDKVGNLKQIVNPKSQIVNYDYDALDQLVEVTDPRSQVTEFRYDKVGNQVEIIDPLLRSTHYGYDLLNRLTVITDALSGVTTYGYDAVGNQIRVTDAEGRTGTTEYDALHRPIETTNPLSGTTTYTYDEVGNVVQIVNPKSQSSSLQYDALNRLVVATDALSGTTTYTYDALGNVTQIVNPKAQIITNEYDALNRLIRATDALSGVIEYEYDPAGNLVRQTDPLGLVVNTTYDALNRPTQVERGTLNVERYTYDALGNLLSQTDANNQTTTYDYDELNRLAEATNPLSQTTIFEYDPLGNLKAVTDPLNRRVEYGYDELYRLETVTDPLNRITQYGYDKVGNQTRLTDAEGIATRYEYDPLNRLEKVTQNYVNGGPQNALTNVQTRFEYDALGNLTQLIDPRSHEQTFDYDALNRLIAQRDALLNETTYEYDSLGNVTQIVNPKSEIVNLQYDALNRLTQLTRPDETVNFTYDAVGNRLSMTDATGTTEYDYDNLYRLTQVTQPSASGGQSSVVAYTYDAKGNRTGLTYPDNTQVAYSYDAADRLTEVADWSSGQTTYGYDAAGQLTEMVLPNGISSTYTYDDAGQLTLLQYQSPISNLQSLTLASYAYAYDAAGNRIQAVETVLTQIFTPTAIFTATPLSGVAPLTVTFDYSTTYATDLTWDFGDGITQTIPITNLQSPISATHIYTSPGLYTVTLTAANDQATYLYTRTNYIAVIPAGAFEEENGQVVMEAENFGARINGATHNWLLKTGQSGYTGTSYLQPLPDVDTLYSSETFTDSPAVEYPINFTTPGTYTVWARGYPTNAAGDSLHVGLIPSSTPPAFPLTSVSGFAPGSWNWASGTAQLVVSTPGPYTLTVWMREDGLRLDRILLITDTAYIPTGDGPAESERTSSGQAFAVPASSVQQALVIGGMEGWKVGRLEGWKVGRLEDKTQLSSIFYPPSSIHYSPSSNLARSPFGQDPTLLLMGPLAAAAPLAGRRKWRRSAWLILLILLALGLMATGTAIAADMSTAEVQGSRGAGETLLPRTPAPLPPSALASLPQLQLGSAGTLTTTYTYDPLYRLTEATSISNLQSPISSFAYTYDAAGNRLTYSINGTQVATNTYNAANWLTQVNNQTYSYDANGNLLDDGLFTYAYDSANRLTGLTSLTDTVSYVYNGDGVRVAQIENGLRTDYVQDVAAALPQVLLAQQGGTVSKYLRGLGLIGEQTGGTGPNAASAVWQYHLPDALGSVRQIADPTGQLLLTQRFDPFGGLVERSTLNVQTAYGFAGEEQDPTSGQLFLRARTYNPATGRFLQSDPVMGTPNDPRTLHHYAYSFNNPVNYTDPSGLWVGTRQQPGGQRQNSSFQNLTNNYSTQSGTQVGYAGPAGRGGFNQAYMGQPGQASGIGSQRAATGPEARNWQPHSDPQPREQSQGKRQKPCGFGGLLFGFGNSALNGNLLKDTFEFAMQIPKLLPERAITNWVDWQIDTLRQMWENPNWRTFANLSFGVSMMLLTTGLALSGVGIPLLIVAGLGTAVASSMFNTWINNGDLQDVRTNLMTDLLGEGVESVGEAVGGAFGPVGSFLGSVVGAGVGQVINNWMSGRPITEGLVANMAVSGLFEGTIGAAGHVLEDIDPLGHFVSEDASSSHYSDFNANCGNSFTAGTPIETDEGQKPVEEVEVGDKVLAEDPETGEQGYFEVVALTNHPTDEILKVTVEAGNGSDETNNDDNEATTLEAEGDKIDKNTQEKGKSSVTSEVMEITPDHPVYIEGKGWVWAENLVVGDRLRRADGGWAKVLAVKRVKLDEPVLVYNFTVKGPHTYFVLDSEILVHNTSCRLYAPIIKKQGEPTPERGYVSGLPRRLQDAIIDSLDEKGVIAVRSRPYRAAGLEKRYPPKTHDMTPDLVVHKQKNGVRTLKDGRKVLSDLDLAGYTINGQNISDQKFLDTFARRFNKAYGHNIITHGTLVNGLDDIGVVKGQGPKKIQEMLDEEVYVFDKNGFVEAINYTEYEAKYIYDKIILYHGTNSAHINSFEQEGFKGIGGGDFGWGFYATRRKDEAVSWSGKLNNRMGNPYVVSVEIPRSQFDTLLRRTNQIEKPYNYDSLSTLESEIFLAVQARGYQGHPTLPFDYIYGTVSFTLDFEQFTFKSQRAFDLLNSLPRSIYEVKPDGKLELVKRIVPEN